MLTLQTRLQTNDRDVAAKVVGGEAIIINLSNGIYYTMDGVAGFVWEQVEAGHPLGEVLAGIVGRYDVPVERAETDLLNLAAQLIQEGIVQPLEVEAAPAGHATAPEQATQPYKPPTLEVFRDIGHLFALDPPMPGLRDVPWNAADEAQRQQQP